MRKFLALLAVLLLWAGAAFADNTQYTLLSAVTTTGASATSVTALAPSGSDLWVVQASGTFTAATVVKLETSLDGTNWDTAVAAMLTGEVWVGPMCNCLVRANVSVHEGGGKTVTIKATLVGAGQLRYQ